MECKKRNINNFNDDFSSKRTWTWARVKMIVSEGSVPKNGLKLKSVSFHRIVVMGIVTETTKSSDQKPNSSSTSLAVRFNASKFLRWEFNRKFTVFSSQTHSNRNHFIRPIEIIHSLTDSTHSQPIIAVNQTNKRIRFECQAAQSALSHIATETNHSTTSIQSHRGGV